MQSVNQRRSIADDDFGCKLHHLGRMSRVLEHKAVDHVGRANPVIDLEGRLPMRAILAGAALTAFFVTPTLADYYIVQEPSTKRCRIVEERPAPGVGVVIGGVGFGVRTKLKPECAQNAERPGPPAAMSRLRSVAPPDNRLRCRTGFLNN